MKARHKDSLIKMKKNEKKINLQLALHHITLVGRGSTGFAKESRLARIQFGVWLSCESQLALNQYFTKVLIFSCSSPAGKMILSV